MFEQYSAWLEAWSLVILWSLGLGIWSFLPGLSASQKLRCASVAWICAPQIFLHPVLTNTKPSNYLPSRLGEAVCNGNGL